MRFVEYEFQYCPNCSCQQTSKHHNVLAVNEYAIIEINYSCGSQIVNRIHNGNVISDWRMICNKPIIKD